MGKITVNQLERTILFENISTKVTKEVDSKSLYMEVDFYLVVPTYDGRRTLSISKSFILKESNEAHPYQDVLVFASSNMFEVKNSHQNNVFGGEAIRYLDFTMHMIARGYVSENRWSLIKMLRKQTLKLK